MQKSIAHFDWGVHGVQQAIKRGDIIIIVDVLSFSTSVAIAIKSLYCVACVTTLKAITISELITGDGVIIEGPLDISGNSYLTVDTINTETIVANVEGMFHRAEGERVGQKRPENMEAYDYLLHGLAYMNKLTPEDTQTALQYFFKAIEKDPGYCAPGDYPRFLYYFHLEYLPVYLATAKVDGKRKTGEVNKYCVDCREYKGSSHIKPEFW